MISNQVIPIILCGGTGSRLWPLSRKSFPKQFLSLTDNKGKTLLQQTQERINEIENIRQPIIICNEEHRFIVAEQMREINVIPERIILEPFGRNTGPAVTLGALLALDIDCDSSVLILSADHEIKNNPKFLQAIKKGMKFSQENRLVTFGVLPTTPETGYGYIEAESKLDFQNNIGSKINQFIEKPNLEKAEELFRKENYAWNSGIFLFKTKTIIQEVNKFCPDMLKNCKKAMTNNKTDLDFQRLEVGHFKKCDNVSIDVAILEKTDLGTVIPLDIGWSDIGSWESLWKTSTKNEDGNIIKGKILLKDTKNSFFRSEERLLVGIGLNNLVAVETNDAVLIANKSKSQEVKEVVDILKNKEINEALEHKKMFRPWGYYISLVQDQNWKVKMILVKPGEKLSLQRHRFRAEHWIVVNGTATVQIEQQKSNLKENQSVFIPKGTKHRLFNEGKTPLKIIEVQTGSYLGEDDIERFEDNYGRLN